MKCLVTGATGFIGGHLVRHLLDAGHEVRAVDSSEQAKNNADGRLEKIHISRNTADYATWQEVCRDVEVIFHLAGRAHHGDSSLPSARPIYFQDNLETTSVLAKAAVKARVRRFIFTSSVAVYGAASVAGKAFREDSPVALHPDNVYALSKLAAEEFLLSNEACAALETVVVRLPLVYGAGAKGNMAALMRLAQSGLPLPLAGIDNRRSFINIPNCVEFLLAAACHPGAGGRILLASDCEDVTTSDLIRAIARELRKPARLFPVPSVFLKMACSLPGQKARFEKLAGNFQIDPSASRALLGWSPRVRFAEGIALMCAGRGARVDMNGIRRFFDLLFSLIGLVLGGPLLIFLWIAGFFAMGSPIFRQTRVGKCQKPFILVKFRTMKPGTASVASHLVNAAAITRWGRFLRRTKLDELPQLWNVLKGEMSLVGPRPCLLNQEDLIRERAERGVFEARPGITGLAQTMGIDMSTPVLLAETDAAMLADLRLSDYFRYIFLTISGRGQGDRAPST